MSTRTISGVFWQLKNLLKHACPEDPRFDLYHPFVLKMSSKKDTNETTTNSLFWDFKQKKE